MSNKDRQILQNRLSKGFSELAPDRWEEIRSTIPSDAETMQSVWEEAEVRPAARRHFRAIAAAAVLLICVLTFAFRYDGRVDALLYIDVNPSICISINESGKVINVEGVNEDGSAVVSSASGEIGNSRDLDKTVTCLISEMDREGYFRDGSLEAIVSFGYMHEENNAVLEQACSSIEKYAESRSLKSSLISQSFARDEAAENTAADIGISAGKYMYIVSLLNGNDADPDTIHSWAEKSADEIVTELSETKILKTETKTDQDDVAVTEKEEQSTDFEKASAAEEQSEANKASAGSSRGNSSQAAGNSKAKAKEKPKKNKEKAQKNSKNNNKNKDKSKNNNGKANNKNNNNKNSNSNSNGKGSEKSSQNAASNSNGNKEKAGKSNSSSNKDNKNSNNNGKGN